MTGAAATHELRYRAGTQGLAEYGVPDNGQPHWYCTCGAWRKNRDGLGRPFENGARRLFGKHVEATAGDPR